MNEPVWIDKYEALVLHNRLLALNGGAEGVRDDGPLESALARPMQLFAYGDNPSIVQMAAAYMAGIVRNHPFVHENKRTSFVVGVLFLELNGYRFVATEEEATQVVLNLAAGQLDDAALAAMAGHKCHTATLERRELTTSVCPTTDSHSPAAFCVQRTSQRASSRSRSGRAVARDTS